MYLFLKRITFMLESLIKKVIRMLKLNISLEVCVECTKKLFGLFDFVSNNEYDPTFIDYVFSKGFVG